MRILVAEDDANTRAGLVEILEGEGYEVISVADGKSALAAFVAQRPELVCLDIMMPGVSGYDVCREIRRADSAVPVIFISAKSEEIDKVLGLEIGADDYIVKPFGVKEVIARIRAVSRRCLGAGDSCGGTESFTIGDLEVAAHELRARRGKVVIDLSLRDIRILRMFHASRGKVLDRDEIFDSCWGVDYMPNSRALDQHISQLRKKIELDPKNPKIIQTVHNAGYRYE